MVDAISKERKLGQKLLKGVSLKRFWCIKTKVVCPVAECVQKVLSFEENRLPQHFRVAHKKK